MHLISDEELHYNESEYSMLLSATQCYSIKALSGSCHIWNLIFMKVLLRKVIGILVKDPEGKK